MLGLMVEGKPLLRAYSIASPSWDDGLDFFSIKVPDGPLTSRLQHIREGDRLLLGRKPTGTLVLDALTPGKRRSEEHTSELQSLMRISYAVFCLKTQKHVYNTSNTQHSDIQLPLL